jgi:Ser/Thr protein kinase RdoA (MazF antagonist)
MARCRWSAERGWAEASQDAIELIADGAQWAGARAEIDPDPAGLATLRLHADCHVGNILWTPADRPGGGPHFVDLDDCRGGPAVQDLWMLLAGDRAERQRQLGALLDGYEQVRDFDRRELALIEPLRTLR